MKNTILLLTALILLLVGCSTPTEKTEPTDPVVTTAPSAETEPIDPTQESTLPLSTYTAPMVTFSSPTVTESYGKDALVYTYQIMELLLEDPQVSDWVTLELLNHTDFTSTAGPALLAEAAETGEVLSLTLLHTPARLDRGILSLTSTQVVSGTGPKATGMMASSTFDLITGRQLSLRDVLIPGYDAQALSDAIISALEPLEKEGSLYSDYAYVITELFSSNAPIENWYLSQTGLCVYFAPYEIAAYKLGTVTAEIPYDSLPGLLREEYFPDEALGLVGNLQLSQDLSLLQTQGQFRDLVLDSNGPEWVLTVEGAVEDLRIETDDPSISLFVSTTLCQGDAIVIHAESETMLSLSVSYRSGGEIICVPLYATLLLD